ncbi:H-NS family nucleoid-associated regulatory protein [Amphibiibacter pelophylacis]|uniref:H-NS histone family protein n=1 Tax=Amphibiibacter pelophylacis TaxID=1799477 RepID=A0ACC6P2G7_9BURK
MDKSLDQLMAEKAALEEQISRRQREERAGAIGQIRDLMQRYDLTKDDIPERGATAGRARSAAAGKKLEAKYRDAATGNSWTGRGLKPRWLRDAIEGGRTLESFAV